MSLKDLNAKMKAVKSEADESSDGHPFTKKGFVKDRIRKQTIAKASSAPPAREGESGASEMTFVLKPSGTARKVERMARRLCDRLTEDDRERNMRVLRDAADAVAYVWDPTKKCQVPVPDHKTRMAAVQVLLAYDEGTPVARQITLAADLGGMDDALEKLKASPAALAVIAALFGGKVEGMEPDVEADLP